MKLHPEKKERPLSYLLNELGESVGDLGLPKYCLFLGSGCSVDSNIPTGKQLILRLQQEAFLNQISNGRSIRDFGHGSQEWIEFFKEKGNDFADYVNNRNEKFKQEIDAKKEDILRTFPVTVLQKEIYNKGGVQSSDEIWNDYGDCAFKDMLYGKWFEEYSKDVRKRQKFIEELINDKLPDSSYFYLGSIIDKRGQYIFRNIFTTNFDDLLNITLIKYYNVISRVYSHEQIADFINLDTISRPNIIKLHGDFLFENNKNTIGETKRLEAKTEVKFSDAIKKFGLLVVGYGGADNSIMSILERYANNFNTTIFWCDLDESYLNWRVIEFINNTNDAWFVKIDSFRELLLRIFFQYKCDLPRDKIQADYDSKMSVITDIQKKLSSDANEVDSLTLNEKKDVQIKTKALELLGSAKSSVDEEEKVRLMREAYATDPSVFDAVSLYNLASMCLSLSRKYSISKEKNHLDFRNLALSFFEKSLILDKNFVGSYYSIAKVYIESYEPMKAVDYANKGLENVKPLTDEAASSLHEMYAYAYANNIDLSRTKSKTKYSNKELEKMYEDAAYHAEISVGKNSSNINAWYQYGNILMKIAELRTGENQNKTMYQAIEKYLHAYERDDKTPKYLMSLGLAYEKLQLYTEAEKHYLGAISLNNSLVSKIEYLKLLAKMNAFDRFLEFGEKLIRESKGGNFPKYILKPLGAFAQSLYEINKKSGASNLHKYYTFLEKHSNTYKNYTVDFALGFYYTTKFLSDRNDTTAKSKARKFLEDAKDPKNKGAFNYNISEIDKLLSRL